MYIGTFIYSLCATNVHDTQSIALQIHSYYIVMFMYTGDAAYT